MVEGSTQSSDVSVVPWDCSHYLRAVESMRARLSRGFLLSRPEKWFPGFAAQWLPLAHSLGIELKIIGITPLIDLPKGLEVGFAGKIDQEECAVLLDPGAAKIIAESFIPGAKESSGRILVEYLARRYLGSLALAWSGPESSSVQFDRNIDPFSVRVGGVIKIEILINSNKCSLWTVLGPDAVARLDGLWRRQVRSAGKKGSVSESAAIEIAQLAVAPSMLAEYVRSGTVIDLEVPISDRCVLKSGGKPWLSGRLCAVGENLGIEIVSGSVEPAEVPKGTTRLGIELGEFSIEPSELPEVTQIGAIIETGIAAGNRVNMVINQEKIGKAVLCTYEGRFAISVE